MNIAGQIKVLSPEAMEMVHQKALELLARKGIAFESSRAVETFRRHGAKVSDHTVFLPKEMVETAIAQTPASFRLEALDEKKGVTVGQGLLVHPPGGEVFTTSQEGSRRAPTLKDFGDLQKIYQACDNIDIAGFQPLSPVDVNERVKGLYCTLFSMRNTNKPILSPMELDTIAQKKECLRLFELAFGREGYLAEHYVTWHAVCSNSPFFYSNFACEGIEVYAQHNQPIILVSAPMTGITSPIYLYSTVIMTMAELLAGLVYAQLIQPGVPVVPSASLTYGNMRFATWECASPDTALMLGASIQMFNDFYRLPSRAQTGVTSSKTIDYQAGMETLQSFLFSALAGVNLTSQSVGTLANLMTSSPEKTVLDNEMIDRVRYIIRGMELTEKTMGMEDLFSALPCQDFMTADSTMRHFRDGWQPSVSDWRSYDAWEKDGEKDVLAQARQRARDIIAQSPETLLDQEQEKILGDYIAFVEKNN
ncbi:MAG: trimethylamine methyltransferase family protein [Bacillota bacterium]|nr:trimethylamine methyltransferase family protein [Bacillota bacterium]